MASLENRVNRLEERAGMSGAMEPMVWRVELFGAKDGKPIPHGELVGVRVRDETLLRPEGESEEAFLARIEVGELAKVTGHRNPVVCMTLIRSKVFLKAN